MVSPARLLSTALFGLLLWLNCRISQSERLPELFLSRMVPLMSTSMMLVFQVEPEHNKS